MGEGRWGRGSGENPRLRIRERLHLISYASLYDLTEHQLKVAYYISSYKIYVINLH